MSQDYQPMLISMSEITPSLHLFLLNNNNDAHAIDSFIDQIIKVKYIPLPVVTVGALNHCYKIIFAFWKELNKAISFGYSSQSTIIIMSHISNCVSYEAIKSVSSLISKNKSSILLPTFLMYKALCLDTFASLTQLLEKIREQKTIIQTIPLTFTVIYGVLLTSLSYALPSLKESIHSNIIDRVDDISCGTPPYGETSPMLDADKKISGSSMYISDEVHLKEIHYMPFRSRGEFVASVLRGSILFVSKTKCESLEYSDDFQDFINEFIKWRILSWKSNEWRNIIYIMCEDAMIKKMPKEFNKVLKIYAHSTNLYNIEKVIFLSDYIKRCLTLLIDLHPNFIIDEYLDIESLLTIIKIFITTDNAEALTNLLVSLIELLPYLNGNSRKRIIFDLLLEQYFRYFFMHWCDSVQFAFQTILLYRITLARFSKLDSLHPKELQLYSSRCRVNYNSLSFDCNVVKRLNERIELLKDILKHLEPNDKNFILLKRSMIIFNKRRKEYELNSKKYIGGALPKISFFRPESLE
ncbi:hypothetical protein EDI_044940 [Entamoeba dispar SAW760]|uniref:Uncharacterized protein n=1 Tax=Entamoeba dispar (strain ATCC PRA-260 / SAW760) TaxID=370354 RepID=B0EHZ4_ENTDS|nr:uncharacterized protein EDI_044940 [Entamoeba dispar SAW760]EDR25938.1 hypothetical protein EDI_044940 [Entamoeba dispar SAW760]|eukprot:EDR25938.1 hypothetical protein EDI_044940 [Entamoeba dispar SAW760]